MVDRLWCTAASRRAFLLSATATAATAALPRVLLAQADDTTPEAKLAADPLRPQFHLLPARNWMNDPNGPIYLDGHYHMFHQYNPQAAVWGDMSWYHSVSPDMLHWTHLPVALTPTPGSPDAYGCFSGSALRVGSRVYQVYTGTRLSSKQLATIRDGEDKIQESQCLAYSNDPRLIRWTKLPEPILPLPPPGMQVTGFRDPSAWKQGDWYYMTVGSGEAKVGGCVLLYRAKRIEDPGSWEYLHKLTSGTWTGTKTANPCDDGEMWECPDFFPLDGAHVLIYSTLGKVIWQSGVLDPGTMLFHMKKTGELDLGAFYAPKTQLDAQGRRILWGWLPERRSEGAMRAAGWSGVMGLPRVLRLDADGSLRVTMLPELATLRAGTLPAAPADGAGDAGLSRTLPASSGELLYAGQKGVPFTLSLRAGGADLLHVRYVPETHSVFADEHEIALEPGDAPTLHAFVDASVLELILGERIGYTKRFYPVGSTAPDVLAQVTGPATAPLRAWAIAPISPNRLTTPEPQA